MLTSGQIGGDRRARAVGRDLLHRGSRVVFTLEICSRAILTVYSIYAEDLVLLIRLLLSYCGLKVNSISIMVPFLVLGVGCTASAGSSAAVALRSTPPARRLATVISARHTAARCSATVEALRAWCEGFFLLSYSLVLTLR